MKYFKSVSKTTELLTPYERQLVKHAELKEMIENKAWLNNPIYRGEAVDKLFSALKEIEERKPLHPGKNLNSISEYIL